MRCKTLFIYIKYLLRTISCYSDIFLIIVGLGAIFVYWLQQRHQLKTSAIEVKEQIQEIESQIQKLNDRNEDFRNIVLYKLGPIISENLWQKNRSILSRHLNREDRKIIQEFYLNAEQLERARYDLVKCLIDVWYHKSFLQQRFILENIYYGGNKEEKIKELNMFLQDEFVFSPEVCLAILKEAKRFRPIIGTTTYEKLLKLSGDKR